MKRITSYIPDSITSMNLLCGTIGVIFACKGRFDAAFILMLAAAVFDFFDGFAARMLGAYSDLGKELDSLADVVSFGVLPSVMLCKIMCTYNFAESFWCYVPLLIAVFSGLRLAKFNIDKRQAHGFIGLPTPACAILCGALAYFTAAEPDSFLAVWCGGRIFIPALSVVLCILLVCEIPMFSMKFSKDDSSALKTKRITFLAEIAIIGGICIFCGLNWSIAPLLAFVVYIVKNLLYKIAGV